MPAGKPPKHSAGEDLTIAGTGAAAAGKENLNQIASRPLGSGLRSLSQSKNQSAAHMIGSKPKSGSTANRTPRNQSVSSPSSIQL